MATVRKYIEEVSEKITTVKRIVKKRVENSRAEKQDPLHPDDHRSVPSGFFSAHAL